MNKKLTILDIADLVSSKSGITKKESELFVKEFFSLAAEVISTGESLTIKGVGAFVPVWVEARTSVDVNTKQPIEIPGHYKLSFTPDKTMKDAVNAPFAAFTTEVVEVEMPEMQEGNVEEEKADTLVNEVSSENVEVIETEEISEDVLQPEIEVVEDTETIEDTNTSEIVIENADSETIVNVQTDVLENSIITSAQKTEDIQKEYRRRTRNGYIFGFLTALVLFAILILLWLFFVKDDKVFSLSFSSFKFSTVKEQVDEQILPTDSILSQENNVDTLIVEPIETENVKIDAISEQEVKYPVIETIQRGKFLTTIAEKHYGDKAFWVYIYRENSGRIWNPRDLKAGFKVVVPAASKYGIDASNPESVSKAKALEKQILYEIE